MRAILLSVFAFPLVATACVVVATPPPEPGPGTPADPKPTADATATADPKPPADPPVKPTATADPKPPEGPPASGAQTCGSRGLAPCPADQFCDFPAGSECGATDRGGTCKPVPQMCTRDYRPVCGCDGQTYPNACSANTKGVSVSKEGSCS